MHWERDHALADVELVRSVYTAWDRGDFSRADWAHPDVELVFADGPAPSKWSGLAGMADCMREVLTSWGQFSSGGG